MYPVMTGLSRFHECVQSTQYPPTGPEPSIVRIILVRLDTDRIIQV